MSTPTEANEDWHSFEEGLDSHDFPDPNPYHFDPGVSQHPTNRVHSETANLLMGKTKPNNTLRGNMTAMKALCSSTCDYERTVDGGLQPGSGNEDDGSDILFRGQRLLFPDEQGNALPFGFDEWTERQMKHLRHYLIEFAVHYKHSLANEDIKPSTLQTYIRSIQRSFADDWGYNVDILSGPIFDCPKEGLLAVLDNKVRQQQAQGHCIESHNVLSRDDIQTLYAMSLSRDTPAGFQTRMVFNIALVTAMRPTALVQLTAVAKRCNRWHHQSRLIRWDAPPRIPD